jgi:hypothetical protein
LPYFNGMGLNTGQLPPLQSLALQDAVRLAVKLDKGTTGTGGGEGAQHGGFGPLVCFLWVSGFGWRWWRRRFAAQHKEGAFLQLQQLILALGPVSGHAIAIQRRQGGQDVA